MTRLNQTLTRWQGMGLMATTLLGTGVFILPQLTIQLAGKQAWLAWLLLTLAILPLALVFAELGRRFPHAGGPSFFVQQAFGKLAGQVIGLMFLCVIPIGAPAALIMTLEFLKPFISLNPWQMLSAELGLLAVLFVLNRRGLQLSGRMQLGLTLLIVGVVLALLLAWLWQQPQAHTSVATGTSTGVLQALGLAIWSFLGIEAITHLSAEFKNAERDFVPAVLGGTLLVGLIYLACTFLSMLAMDKPLAIVGVYEHLLGQQGAWILSLLGVASGIATVNVYFSSAARLAWSLSEAGLLPNYLSNLNQHHVPTPALLTLLGISAGTLIAVFVFAEHYASMIRWVNGVFVLIYLASLLAAWRLVRKRFRPAIVLGCLVCAVFAWSLGSALAYGVGLAVVLGTLLFSRQYWFKMAASG